MKPSQPFYLDATDLAFIEELLADLESPEDTPIAIAERSRKVFVLLRQGYQSREQLLSRLQ